MPNRKYSFLTAPVDDKGHPLEIGRKYSVYQTNGTSEEGVLAFWNGVTWIDADTLEDAVPAALYIKGRFRDGVYEFASPLPFALVGEILERILRVEITAEFFACRDWRASKAHAKVATL